MICIKVNVHNIYIMLIYEKFHFEVLLPFVRVGQYDHSSSPELLYVEEKEKTPMSGIGD